MQIWTTLKPFSSYELKANDAVEALAQDAMLSMVVLQGIILSSLPLATDKALSC